MSIQRQKPACLWIHDCQWVKYGDHLAELAAKEREIERLKTPLKEYRKEHSEREDASHIPCEEHSFDEDYGWGDRRCDTCVKTDNEIAARAAEKGKAKAEEWMKTPEQRIASLEAERDALKAQMERLSAPVSDEEWASWTINLVPEPKSLYRCEIDGILAARAAEKGPRNER